MWAGTRIGEEAAGSEGMRDRQSHSCVSRTGGLGNHQNRARRSSDENVNPTHKSGRQGLTDPLSRIHFKHRLIAFFFFSTVLCVCLSGVGGKIPFVCYNANLVAYNDINLLSRSFGSQTSKTKVKQGRAPSRGSKGVSVPAFRSSGGHQDSLTCGFRTPICASKVTSPSPFL